MLIENDSYVWTALGKSVKSMLGKHFLGAFDTVDIRAVSALNRFFPDISTPSQSITCVMLLNLTPLPVTTQSSFSFVAVI